jgi:hypothetical protein
VRPVWLCCTSAIVVSLCRQMVLYRLFFPNVVCCAKLCSWPYAILHAHQWHNLPKFFMLCPTLCFRRLNLHQLWATSHRNINMDRIHHWSFENCLAVKPEKTQALLVNPPIVSSPIVLPLLLGSNHITFVDIKLKIWTSSLTRSLRPVM